MSSASSSERVPWVRRRPPFAVTLGYHIIGKLIVPPASSRNGPRHSDTDGHRRGGEGAVLNQQSHYALTTPNHETASRGL
jgi:hypothetical protein